MATSMQRVPHDDQGFWLKEYKYIKTNPYVKKYYLDSASYILYSINIKLNESDELVITHPHRPPDNGLVNLYFGQQFSPQRNIELFTKFYFDQDLSINRAGLYNTFSEIETEDGSTAGKTNIFELTGDTLADFYYRNGFDEELGEQQSFIPGLEQFYDLYFGYARVQNFKPHFDPIQNYEAIGSQVLSNLDQSCFKWIKIVDGVFEDVEEEDKRSGAMIIDFKAVLNVDKMKQWIVDNFSDKLVDMINKISTRSIDFNFMFYPPSSTGLQLEDVPVITYPVGILKKKVIQTVEFDIKRSLVNNSQKVFEIYFIDNANLEVIYGDNSLVSPSNYTLITKEATFELQRFTPENGVFEDLSLLDFPVGKFSVKYTLRDDVSKYLSNHLNYTILIKVTDLTSERKQ